jgi:hypothetical protein
VILPLCIITGSHWGLIGVASAFGIYSLIERLLSQYLLERYLNLSIWKYLKTIIPSVFSAFVATIAFVIPYNVIGMYDIGIYVNIARSIVLSVLWLAVYYYIISWVAENDMIYLKGVIRGVLERGSKDDVCSIEDGVKAC